MTELLARPVRPWALRLLPPFPAVANRVLALVNDEDVAARQISEIIQLDPTFTAEILRVANSALFGLAREIATVRHAVSLLGLDRVKAIGTLIALHSMVKPAMRMEALRKIWIHSLVTAMLTEETARAAQLSVEGAYTAGMLHNLGTLGLMSVYPEEYTRMLEVTAECGFDVVETERELFEIDHCTAGACLAEEWSFPEVIVQAIATHHQEPGPVSSLAAAVRVAWRLGDVLGFAAFPPDRFWSQQELLDLIPGVPATWMAGDLDVVQAQVRSRLNAYTA